MFWLYLIIFSTIVFVPYFIDNPWHGLTEDQTESLVIFVLALGALFLYVASENKFLKQLREKITAQHKHSNTTKDLSESYSYIGIVNRKLDLLKSIILNIPSADEFTEERQKEMYSSICEALTVVNGDDNYILRFIDMKSCTTLLELKGDDNYNPFVDNKQLCVVANKEMIDVNDDCIATACPRDIDCVRVYIVLRKNTHVKEDPDYIKTIASQALLIYSLAQKQEQAKMKLA